MDVLDPHARNCVPAVITGNIVINMATSTVGRFEVHARQHDFLKQYKRSAAQNTCFIFLLEPFFYIRRVRDSPLTDVIIVVHSTNLLQLVYYSASVPPGKRPSV